MANINTKWFDSNEDFDLKTVGDNRQMQRVTSMGVTWTYYYLHGNNITIVINDNGYKSIQLDTCGYATETTRDAMNEFLSLYNHHFKVSFAGGNFTVTKKGEVVQRVPLSIKTSMIIKI